jgi:hypothetical protein
MEPPYLNLYDLAGILMIATGGGALLWLLGALPLHYIGLIAILFIAACFFAKKGEQD